MIVLQWYLGCGGWGVLLSLVLQRGRGSTPLKDALVAEGGCRFVVRWLDLVGLGRGQRSHKGLGAAEPDGAVEYIGIELQMALESLWEIVCTRRKGPLAGAALGGAGRLDEAVPDRRGGASKVEPAVVLLGTGGKDVGHEAGHRCAVARRGRGRSGGRKLDDAADRLRPKRGRSAVAGVCVCV